MPDPHVRLILIAPADGGRLLDAVLGRPSIACVLLRADGLADASLRPLIERVQASGAAAILLDDDGTRALAVGADGIHVEGAGARLAKALRRLKPAHIVGAGGLPLRDDAMQAGETEVDYLMFGEDTPTAPFDERLDRVAWWAEIFQVPCVACVYAFEEIAPMAAAGAEFIALGDLVFADPRGPVAAIAEAEALMQEGEAAFLARQAERV